MITINLKPGTKRAKAGAGAMAGGLGSLKALTGKVKDPWPMAAIAAWVLAIGFLAWVGVGASMRMGQLEPELDQARSENRRHRQLLAQKRKAEAARDSVVAQIATIRQVDRDRYTWPHILDEVSRALPPWTWLVGFVPVAGATDSAAVAAGITGERVQLTGRTMDIQGLTRFMRQLEDSPFLANVVVISSNTILDAGRAVTQFVVEASFSPPGRSHLRTTTVSPAREG
jgi:Tfp pilus assembly protein PilN